MSISYEEALATLESMFSAPWDRESLDAVLRHQKGHMENTVECILRHGDGDPQVLIAEMDLGNSPTANAEAVDAQLALQLQRQGSRQAAPAAPAKKGRGTPTILPPDFLRIPNTSAAATSSSGSNTMSEDEALARMLQDELFSEELARNPDFAHLARGRPRTSGGLPMPPSAARRASRITEAPQRGGQEGPNIIKAITDLGDNARKRLSLLAAQFQANREASRPQEASVGAERRGLLDEDNMELAARKDL